MTATDDLAREIADLKRRLASVERSSQLGRSSIDGGALTVNDENGTPVLSVGRQDDGGYSILGANGGRVVASDLDLPAGSITETDIADDSISTPKLRANSVTADTIAAGAVTAVKIDADAINGRLITGVTITGADITADGLDGSYVRLRTGTDSTAIAEFVPAPQAGHPLNQAGRIQSYSDPGGAVSLIFESPAADTSGPPSLELWSYQQDPKRRAILNADAIYMTSGETQIFGDLKLTNSTVTVDGTVNLSLGTLDVKKSNATATVTSGLTERQDTGVGNVTFTAVSGRRYEVTYAARVGAQTLAPATADLRIRDGGASAPTITSTTVAAGSVYLPIVGGAGESNVVVTQTLDCPADIAAGTHTLGAFYVRTSPTGSSTATVAVAQATGQKRELRVNDVGIS